MYQEFFLQKGVLILPIVAMSSFVLSFVAILLWSLRTAQKTQYETLAQLPLIELSAPSAGREAQRQDVQS